MQLNKNHIKSILAGAPKFIVMVLDRSDSPIYYEDDPARVVSIPSREDEWGAYEREYGVWYFTAINGKHLIQQLKKHKAPGRVMLPFATNLEPVQIKF